MSTPDGRQDEMLRRLEALGLPSDLCRLDATVDEILDRSGDLTWYSAISLAETELGGALPPQLIESLSTLGDLFEFVEVRRAHGSDH